MNIRTKQLIRPTGALRIGAGAMPSAAQGLWKVNYFLTGATVLAVVLAAAFVLFMVLRHRRH